MFLRRGYTRFLISLKELLLLFPLMTSNKPIVSGSNLIKLILVYTKINNSVLFTKFRLYDRIFSFLPIQDPDDIMDELKKNNPEKTNEELVALLNQNEDIDMIQFYREYSDCSLEVFKKFVTLFEYVEMQKSKIEKNYRTIFINVNNKFWSFVFDSSQRIFNQVYTKHYFLTFN